MYCDSAEAVTLLENWDPMSEGFNSPSFNSYDKGPAALMPLSNGCENSHEVAKSCTLYVLGIPCHLKEDGLKEMFSACGTVLTVKIGSARNEKFNGRGYGFVEYATIAEAQKAISHLNGTPPYNLKIQFSASKKDRQVRQQVLAEDKNKLLAKSTGGTFSRDEKEMIQITVSQKSNSHLVTYRGLVSDDEGDPKDRTNVSSHGKVTISNENLEKCMLPQHYADMTGICTFCKNNVEHTHIIHIFGKGNIRETVILDDMDVDALNKAVCLFCKSSGKLLCSGCLGCYCSETCQKQHWPEHKYKCSAKNSALPRESLKNNSPPSSSKNSSCIKSNDLKNFKRSSSPEKCRHNSRNNTSVSPQNKSESKSNTSGYMTMANSERDNCAKLGAINQVTKGDVVNTATSKFTIPKENLSGKMCQVVLAFITGPDDLWLQKCEKTQDLEQLMVDIQAEAANNHLLRERPALGDYCIAMFSEDHIYYRVQVKSVEKNTCKVQYIDFGNEESMMSKELLCLPAHLAALPAQAISCALYGINLGPMEASSRLTFSNKIRQLLQSTSKIFATTKGKLDNGKLLVDLKNDAGISISELLIQNGDVEPFQPSGPSKDKDNCLLRSKPTSNSSTLSALQLPPRNLHSQTVGRNEGFCSPKLFIRSDLNKIPARQVVQFVITMIEDPLKKIFMSCGTAQFEKLVEIEKEIAESAQTEDKNLHFTPNKHDIVAAYSPTDNYWYRALVLQTIGVVYKVLYIDYGNEEVVEKVMPLSPQYAELNSALIQGIVQHNLSQEQILHLRSLRPIEPFAFYVKHVTEEYAELEISDGSGTILIGRPWYYGYIELHAIQPIVPLGNKSPKSHRWLESLLASKKGKMITSRVMVSSVKERTLEPTFVGEVIYGTTVPPICLHIISEKESLACLMNDLKKHFDGINFRTYRPEKDEMVCIRSVMDQRLHRGRVEHVTSTAAEVHLVDFGFVEKVALDRIQPLPDAFRSHPFYAIGVELDGVPADIIDADVLTALKGTPFKVEVTSQTSPVKVKLYMLEDDSVCLNDVLMQTNTETSEVPSAVSSQPLTSIKYDAFPHQTLLVGQMIEVYVCTVETPTDIICVPLYNETSRTWQWLIEKAAELAETSSTPYIPEWQDVCMVKREEDGIWYRAAVLHIAGKDVQCLLIDLGSIENVNIDSVRHLPAELSTVPRLMVHCTLEGVPSMDTWDADTIQKLKSSLTEGAAYQMNVVSESDTVDYSVTFPNLALSDIL